MFACANHEFGTTEGILNTPYNKPNFYARVYVCMCK